jgi:hypothetical protein
MKWESLEVIMCIIIVQMHLCKLLYACGGAFLCDYEVSMPFSDLKQKSLFFFFFSFSFQLSRERNLP